MIAPVYSGSWGTISIEIPKVELSVGDIDKDNTIFLHLEQKEWSKEIYKEMLDVFSILVDDCKLAGYKFVASVIPSDDILTNKFQSMFGLKLYAGSKDNAINIYYLEL